MLPLMVTESVAANFREQMLKPDLVFLTEHNKEKIERMIKRGDEARCEICGKLVAGPHECEIIKKPDIEDERPIDMD